MRFLSFKFKLWCGLGLVIGGVLAAGSAAGASVAQTRQMREIKGAVLLWTRLQGLHSECPGSPDDEWRLQRLSTLAEAHFSPRDYLKELNAQPEWSAGLTRDVRMILKGAGGCGTDAMREWVAGARRVLDTTMQYVSGAVTTHWPAPALLAPIRIDIKGMDMAGADDPGTLRVSIHNPEQDRVGVALSGKELRAGLCSTITSPDMPITVATDVPDRLLIVAPGESKSVALVLDPECFAQTTGSFSGAVVIVRNGAAEYRALDQLEIPITRDLR